MKNHHWIVLGVLLYGAYRLNKSAQGDTALQNSLSNEAAVLSTSDGTNWTRSLWDPVSGQPSYMFGAVPVQSGTAQYFRTMGPELPASVYGHM